jgi:hypothetical protein
MSNFTDFFPAASGGAEIITDPKALPIVSSKVIYLKDANTNLWGATNTSFWENNRVITSFGSGRVLVNAANTYYTICDLTGSGYFYNAISPSNPNSPTVVTMRFTVDDVITEFSSTLYENRYRVFVGAHQLGAPMNNQSYGNPGYGSYYDAQGGAGYNQYPTEVSTSLANDATAICIYTIDAWKSLPLPKLRFETNFKLEMKSTQFSSSEESRNAWAGYKLD